ncbi:MAG: Mfa1 fimbrilin C-terminal domain-containing protein [Prevotella sp.]|nr:Mfa1 fimbrilin C-terminal domain-containing protein [Prevotella sp.]
MKKLALIAMAAVGLLFVACSSDKDVAADGSNPNFRGQTEGFFKVNINLPATVVTGSMRAEGWIESSNLDDGLDTEYAVDKVLLLIFEGASESEATLKQAIDLGAWGESTYNDTPNQITTRKDYVAKLNNLPTGTNKLYALAVVNPGSVIATTGTANKIKVKGDELDGPNLAAIKEKLAASTSVSTNDFIYTAGDPAVTYFFMTNAVLSDKAGGSAQPTGVTPQTLAPVDPTYVYETEEDAKKEGSKAATDIYVERAVAKVTLNETSETGKYLETDALGVSGSGISLNASLTGWTLDNTNKSSYIIRQVPASFSWELKSKESVTNDPYRFVGGNPVEPTVALYRTYWAEDPNYGIDYDAANFTKVDEVGTNTNKGNDHPLYCLENTFDVEHQTSQNTTRALLAVKLINESSTDFYVIGADRKTLYTETEVEKKIISYVMSQPVFQEWFADQGTGTLKADDPTPANNITVEWNSNDAGKITVTKITIPASNMKNSTAQEINSTDDYTYETTKTMSGNTLFATLNAQLANVERFKDGVAYYEVRIKHFGDAQTPWNDGEYEDTHKPAESTIATIYPAGTDGRQDANYLGRYGMVRNNWYDLQVGEILKIGDSTVPDLTIHPDDELDELYIKARINILSWAKRPQGVKLK